MRQFTPKEKELIVNKIEYLNLILKIVKIQKE